MAGDLTVTPESWFEANVSDVVLDEKKTTRTVFRPRLVRNDQVAEDQVNGRFVRQKKRTASQEWEDFNKFNEKTMKGGEEVQIRLNAAALRKLFDSLSALYRLPIEFGGAAINYTVLKEGSAFIAEGTEMEILQALVENAGAELFPLLEELSPEFLTVVALNRQFRERTEALEQFETQMTAEIWKEENWQVFFEQNTWIFGHNLAYQFLTFVEEKAYLGGKQLSNSGGNIIDYVLGTEADAGFTVLVDIKRPDQSLMHDTAYRKSSGVYHPSKELIGGVSQLQTYCRTWAVDLSRNPETAIELAELGLETVEPKGILVVGDTSELTKSQEKRTCFELFRRNVRNPEILTFDELLARARYQLRVDSAELIDEQDEVPF